MNTLTLYRRALRSGRVEFMSEVIVRLSNLPDTDFLIESLKNAIQRKLEDNEQDFPTPSDRMKLCTGKA